MYASVHKDALRRDTPFDLVAVAASAGGLKPTIELLAGLPAEFPCPILIVVHMPPANQHRSVLDRILRRRTRLHVRWASDGEPLRPGCVLLAPQDHHAVIAHDHTVRLLCTPKVNWSRPAADPLFSSMAVHLGPRAIGVVLSGALWDGAQGAIDLVNAGGRVLVQDRDSALQTGMPLAAIRSGAVDFEVAPRLLAPALITLTMAAGAAAWFTVWNRKVATHASLPPDYASLWGNQEAHREGSEFE